MATIELERTLVKSPPELWDEIASDAGLSRWLGEVQVRKADPPTRLEWHGRGAHGVIELEAAGWGTKVRAQAETAPARPWDKLRGGGESLEQRLGELLDDLGASSLKSG
jgi:uncharacterized protein YndB with AHSA1/START domain